MATQCAHCSSHNIQFGLGNEFLCFACGNFSEIQAGTDATKALPKRHQHWGPSPLEQADILAPGTPTDWDDFKRPKELP